MNTFGIIIPCYNEETVLPMLFERLDGFVQSVNELQVSILFVDDGSHDATWTLLRDYCSRVSFASAIGLSRNFGHQTAVSAGLANMTTDIVGVMDADLQDPPEHFTEMLNYWKEGYEVVYAVRKNRKEHFFLKGAYWIFYRLLKKVSNIEIALDAGDFALMDRKVVEWINLMPEHNRFIRGLRGWVGFSQIGVPYNRNSRAAGEPKYTLRKLFGLAMDGLISFSSIPLKVSGWLGIASAFFGFFVLAYELIQLFFFQHPPRGWASTFGAIVFFGGIQLIVLGLLGQYLGRVFDEVKRRPIYVAGRTAGNISLQSLVQPGNRER